jgi:hypothetical protein
VLTPLLTEVLDTWTDVEVASLPTTKLTVALCEPARFEPPAGANTAESCSGEAGAANDVRQLTVALWAELSTGIAMQPLIGVVPFSNVTVPEGGDVLRPDVTVAIRVTSSFVTLELGDVASIVVLAIAVWTRVACPETLGLNELSVAVIVGEPTVGELVMVALYVPWPWSVTGPTISPESLDLNETASFETGCERASVTVAVAVVVDVPSAGIDEGVSCTVTVGARPSAHEGTARTHQVRALVRTPSTPADKHRAVALPNDWPQRDPNNDLKTCITPYLPRKDARPARNLMVAKPTLTWATFNKRWHPHRRWPRSAPPRFGAMITSDWEERAICGQAWT